MMEGTLPFTNADRAGPRLASSDLETKNNNQKAKHNMKTIIKTVLYLQMTALLLTTALAGPRAAEKGKPFHGRTQAVEVSIFHPPTFSVDGSGAGRATHFGHFTFTYEFEVTILTGVGVGSAEFTAANGDSLFTGVLGQGSEVVDAVAIVVESHTITGGTGRFAGATGSFTLERVVNVVTGVTAGSFRGTIVLHKKEHKAD